MIKKKKWQRKLKRNGTGRGLFVVRKLVSSKKGQFQPVVLPAMDILSPV